MDPHNVGDRLTPPVSCSCVYFFSSLIVSIFCLISCVVYSELSWLPLIHGIVSYRIVSYRIVMLTINPCSTDDAQGRTQCAPGCCNQNLGLSDGRSHVLTCLFSISNILLLFFYILFLYYFQYL